MGNSAGSTQYLRQVKVRTEVDLDVMQINDSARALDAAMASKEHVLATLSQQKNDAKSAIDRLESKITELRREISTGRGERDVLAEEVAFYSENKVRTLGPGGRVLGERTLRQDEIQQTLPGVENPSPAEEGYTEVFPELADAGEEDGGDEEVVSESASAIDEVGVELEKQFGAELEQDGKQELSAEFILGKEAALAGAVENDNPYPLGSPERVQWLGGWFLGREILEERGDDGKEPEKSSSGPFDGEAIIEEGRKAFKDGLSDLENPHDKGSMKRVLWNQGWTDAEEDAARSGDPTERPES